MSEPTPTTLDEFTPAWLTSELRRTKTIEPDSTVTAVDYTILGEGEGFMGIIGRMSLSYGWALGVTALSIAQSSAR